MTATSGAGFVLSLSPNVARNESYVWYACVSTHSIKWSAQVARTSSANVTYGGGCSNVG